MLAVYRIDPFANSVAWRSDAMPRLGDIVLFGTGAERREGIVTWVWRDDQRWHGVQLLHETELLLVAAPEVGETVGRPRGISRIDQVKRRTHGWFVRIYEQGSIYLARMFSDGKLGGPGPALIAALALRADIEAQRESARNHDRTPLLEQEVAGAPRQRRKGSANT
jgi:hypothetical protein